MNTLHAQLHTLAAHVRDPATQPGPPGIEDRRLQVYRELVLNNLDGLLAGTFPVIRKTLRGAAWQALLQEFLQTHSAQTPLFTQLGLEFVAYLEATPTPLHPWLAELAHYEWAELGLQLCDAAAPHDDPQAGLLDGIPILSPLAWPLAYHWPVQAIGPDFQPLEPPPAPTLVLLHRQHDGRIHFSQLSPLLFALLQHANGNTCTRARDLLEALAAASGTVDLQTLLTEAIPMLQQLRANGVLAWRSATLSE